MSLTSPLRRRPYSPFVRRLRAAARLALYGSLAVTAAAAWLGSRLLQPSLDLHQPWLENDYAANPEVRLLQEFVRIDTSFPTGSELAGAQFLAAQLAAAGVSATIERIGATQANLWAVLEGEEPGALVLHQHLDTDPVPNPDRWSYPPFAGTLDGPWIYGRGVFDMKSVGIAQLAAFLELKNSGRKPRRSLVLLATGSEERGSDVGMKWILREHPELGGRFWAVLTEGGVVEARSPTDLKYWGTEFAQRRHVEVRLCSQRGGRLEDFRADLLARTESGPLLTPEAAAYFRAYAPSRDRPALRALLSDPESLVRTLDGLSALPQLLRGAVTSSCHPGPVTGDPEAGFQIAVNCLLLPGVEFEEVARELLPAWMTHGLAVTVREVSAAASGSPLDHPVLAAIDAELERRLPDAQRGPWLQVASFTDARFLRPAGVPTYGFSPFPFFVTDTMRVGDPDEHVSLDGFVSGVENYRRVVERLVF